MSRFFFLFSFLLLILWFYKSSTVVPSCFLEALHLTQNSCIYERNTFYQNLKSSTVTTFYLEPQSDSALLFFLLIQVINGLMDREDWQEAIQIPLGILPGGSGNALAASIHHYSQWVDPLMSHLNAWVNSPKDKPSSVLEKKDNLSHACVIMPKADWAHHFLRRETRLSTALLCGKVISGSSNSQRNDVMGLKTGTLWVIIVQSAAGEHVDPAHVQGVISICWLVVSTTSKGRTEIYTNESKHYGRLWLTSCWAFSAALTCWVMDL